MILTIAILVILTESIGEGILKRFKPTSFIFDNYVQWVIAVFLFSLWFIVAYHFCSIPVAKLIIGFVFVRFAIFDVVWNLSNKQKWNYYGTVKWYDRTMAKLGSFGWFMKFVVFLPMGIVFLLR
jgi:hypothetical protein